MNIEQILEDLYTIDPELKNYESEIKDIVSKLLESKPNTKFDKNFILKLKKDLNILNNNKVEKNFNINQKFIYVFAGVTLCAILIIPISLFMTKKVSVDNNISLNFKTNIETLKDNAFGDLALINNSVSRDSVESAVGLGGGGGANLSQPMTTTVDMPVGSTKSMIMPPIDITSYNFIYSGDDFVLDSAKVDVFKRNKETNISTPDFLNSFNLNLVDLTKFSNSGLQNFSIEENIDFGHIINVNFTEGIVAIFENNKWPHTYSSSLSMSDIPSDDQIIKIANDYLEEKNIDLEFYSKPYVDNSWRTSQQMNDNMEIYIPETMTVIYPIMLNNKIIYEQNGNASGLMININIRYKKVASIWNLKLQNYEKSSYDCETDKDKILDIARSGGINFRQYSQSEKSIDLNLNTPEQIYINYYKYDNGETQELIIPALRFEITDRGDSNFIPQFIIVPIVREIFDNLTDNPDIPILYRDSSSR